MPLMFRFQTVTLPSQFQIQPRYFQSHGLLIQLPPDVLVTDVSRLLIIADNGMILHESSGEECHTFARIDGYTIPERYIGSIAKDSFFNLNRFDRLEVRLYRHGVEPDDFNIKPREYWHIWRVLL